jgi:hypothetical protein
MNCILVSRSGVTLPPSFNRDSSGSLTSSSSVQGYYMFSQRQQAYMQRTSWEHIKWGSLADDIDPIPTPQQYPTELLLLVLRTLRMLSV